MKRSFSLALIGAMAFGAVFFLLFDHDAFAQAVDWFGDRRRGYYEPPNTAHWRLLIIALSGGAGFVVGWFLSPHAKGLRLAIVSVIAFLLVLVVLLDNGVWGWGLVLPMSATAFMMGLGYWARGPVQRFMASPPDLFGNGKFANDEELESQGLTANKGVRLGFKYMGDTDTAICYPGDRHGLTCGPTRTHKGASFIVPNLLTYPGSVVVIDPKGENARITADHRRSMGQEVHVVDPWQITGMDASCYNPLDHLVVGDIDMADDAMMLADAKIIPSDREPFWSDEAKAIVHGINGYVASDPDEDGQRHLGRVRDLCLLDGDVLKELFHKMQASPYHFVRSAGARCLQKEDKLLSNVLATLQSQTHFLDSPRMRESLSRSDFSFGDLKTKPMTIYLVLPSDKLDTFGRWLRLLIQQAITANARDIETKPAHSVLFFWMNCQPWGSSPWLRKPLV